MADSFILWFQNFCGGISKAFVFITSKPFENIAGLPNNIANLTPLELIGIGGLMVFIVVAIVKWVIS